MTKDTLLPLIQNQGVAEIIKNKPAEVEKPNFDAKYAYLVLFIMFFIRVVVNW